MAGDCVPIDAASFLSEPFDKADAIGDFLLRFEKGLAHFCGENAREIIGIVQQELVPLEQDC